MGNDVAETVDGIAVQLDAFAVKAFGPVRRVADDRVVDDVPVAATLLQVDRVMIVEEQAAADDDAGGALFDINAYG